MNTALLETAEPEVSEETELLGTAQGVGAKLLEPGTIVAGKYAIRGKLGEGGFAVVYDAEHLGLGRHVAIKVVHIDDEMPHGVLERARREARNSALVRHPNVLEVFDTGSLDDGSPYLVMERIDGETLSQRIARQGLTVPAVVELGRQLMLALEALAAHDMLHRDVKPENVMLHDRGDGRLIVKLVDFGIAKRKVGERDVRLTRDGALVGTPSYMSPEQLLGQQLDERTDIYSSGAVLYEALVGSPPHDRESLEELMLAALHDRVRPIRATRPTCPRELERIVLKALARSRDERYPSAAAMRQDLERLALSCGLPRASKAWHAVEPIEPAAPVRPHGVLRRKLGSLARSLEGRAPLSRGLQAALVVALVGLGGGAVKLAPGQAAHATNLVPTALPVTQSPPAPRLEVLPVRGESEPRLLKLDRPEEARDDGSPRTSAEETDSAANQERSARRARRPERREEPRTTEPRTTVRPQEAAVFAMRATPNASSREIMDQALAAYAMGRYATAQQLYRKALELDPNDAAAHRGLGLLAARRGAHAEARAAFERYLELAPRAADAAAIRARVAALPSGTRR
jgi:tetratricopeptide (TPR) repeat protein